MGEKIADQFSVTGGDFSRAGYASSQIKKSLKKLGVDMAIIKRTVVATYEGEVNIVAHAWSGKIVFTVDDEKIRIVLEDEGPGIEDIGQAMQEGFSTATSKIREMGFGAGMGLSNMKKNADHLHLESEVGKGTRVEITMHRHQTEG